MQDDDIKNGRKICAICHDEEKKKNPNYGCDYGLWRVVDGHQIEKVCGAAAAAGPNIPSIDQLPWPADIPTLEAGCGIGEDGQGNLSEKELWEEIKEYRDTILGDGNGAQLPTTYKGLVRKVNREALYLQTALKMGRGKLGRIVEELRQDEEVGMTQLTCNKDLTSMALIDIRGKGRTGLHPDWADAVSLAIGIDGPVVSYDSFTFD